MVVSDFASDFAILTPELPDGPVTNAANSLIQAGILGALVLLLGMALAYVVLKWNRTNELRVKDQKESVEATNKQAASYAVDYTKLVGAVTEALRELVGTTDALKEAVKANTEASRTMERSVNEALREAIRAASDYRRRFTPPGSPPGSAPSKGAE